MGGEGVWEGMGYRRGGGMGGDGPWENQLTILLTRRGKKVFLW